jgi:hypothetical protein
MKNLYTALTLLIAAFLSACNAGSLPPVVTPTAPPHPTVVLQVEATPAPEIKPIESQPTPAPAIDAPLIAYNEIKEGRLDEPAGVDEWVFKAQAGERVNIVLNSQFDSYLELFGPEGEFIASNDDNAGRLNSALFELPIHHSGPHLIKIRGYGGATGAYALALTGGHPTIGGGALNSDDSRTVVLSQEGLKWHYQGQHGTYLTLTVTAVEPVDSRLALYGPDGALLASDDDSGGGLNAEIYEFQLPADGLYTIQAHSVANTGLVTLTVTGAPQASGGGPLALGKTQVGTLKPGRSHAWNFVGETGQIVTIGLNSIDFDTFLELRNSQGVILAENDSSADSSNAAINLFALPADDTYTVIARSAAEGDGGDYDISVKPVKVATGGGPLTPDQPSQALLVPGQNDTWLFEAEAGSFITVQLQSEQVDTYLGLYGPDEALLAEDDDSGGGLNAALLDFSVPAGGEYKVIVKPARSDRADQAGVYEIRLTINEALATTGLLASGEVKTSSLAAGEQHTWTFEAEEDFFATIKMESGTLDTHLSLYDRAGVLLAVNDDFLGKQAVIANFIVPRTGEYRLVARAYSAEEAGDYRISLEISDEALPLAETPAAENK